MQKGISDAIRGHLSKHPAQRSEKFFALLAQRAARTCAAPTASCRLQPEI